MIFFQWMGNHRIVERSVSTTVFFHVVVEQPTMLLTTPIPSIPTALEPASVGNDPVVDRC
jgi:hypothetical protein